MDLSNVDPLVWVIAGVVALLVVVALIVLATRQRRQRQDRRRQLQERFGPEYERTVDAAGSRKRAEEDLLARQERRSGFEVLPVPMPERDRLRERWGEVQNRFVDAPHAALRRADELLDEVANLKGYPDASREQRLADLSVDHPAAVERYRSAQPAEGRGKRRGGDREESTEQVREALLAARDLFEALLNRGEPGSRDTPPTPFQELVAEDEGEVGEGSARAETSPEDEDTAVLPAAGRDDRRGDSVDTGGTPVLGPDGRPLRDDREA